MIERSTTYLKRNKSKALILSIAIILATTAITVAVSAGSMTSELENIYSGKGGISLIILSNLKNITSWLLLIVSGASLLILALIFTFWIRSRKHETGVLLALGKPKTEILIQYITEALIVGILSISIGLIPGNLISGNFNSMLFNKAGEDAKYGSQANKEGVSQDKSELKLNRTGLNGKDIVTIYSIAGGTVIFSTVLALNSFILKSPRKILLGENQ